MYKRQNEDWAKIEREIRSSTGEAVGSNGMEIILLCKRITV